MTIAIHKSVHKIINNNGMSLWMPSNIVGGRFSLQEPNIYAQSSTQLYPLGTKLEFADGRVFRYAKFGETSTTPPLARVLCNANLVPGSAATNGYEGTLDSTSDVAVGSTKLIMNDTTDRVENAYEDGMLAVFPTLGYHEYRISGSEAATDVDDVTIYLDSPLNELLVVDSTGITAYPSIYSNAQYMPATGYESAIGVILTTAMTTSYFAWIQTWGRCIITPTAYFGDSANERLAMMWSDGTIATAATADPSSGYQILGYLTQKTINGYGDLEIMLQLGR
jgi:hypothetical protein